MPENGRFCPDILVYFDQSRPELRGEEGAEIFMIFYLTTKEVELSLGTPLKYPSVTPKKLIGGKTFLEFVLFKKLFQVMFTLVPYLTYLTYLTLPTYLTYLFSVSYYITV